MHSVKEAWNAYLYIDCKKDHGGISFANYTEAEVDGLRSPWGPKACFYEGRGKYGMGR